METDLAEMLQMLFTLDLLEMDRDTERERGIPATLRFDFSRIETLEKFSICGRHVCKNACRLLKDTLLCPRARAYRPHSCVFRELFCALKARPHTEAEGDECVYDIALNDCCSMFVCANTICLDKTHLGCHIPNHPWQSLSYISLNCLQVSASSTVCLSSQILCHRKIYISPNSVSVNKPEFNPTPECILMSHFVLQSSGNLSPGVYGTPIRICICQSESAGSRRVATLQCAALLPSAQNPQMWQWS